MLRKHIHFLYGGGISILLIAGVIVFNHYQNSQLQEPVNIYKDTEPSQQVPKAVKPTASLEVAPQSETLDIEETWTSEVEVSEEFVPEQVESVEPSEALSVTEAQELSQEDPKVVLLKEVFSGFDRIMLEGQELLKDIQEAGGWTHENRAAFEARGRALEAENYDYFQRIAEEFPGSVTFALFEGEEWTYDVDFQMLKDSIKGSIPSELEPHFRYASAREMFGLPEMPPEWLQQGDIQMIRR